MFRFIRMCIKLALLTLIILFLVEFYSSIPTNIPQSQSSLCKPQTSALSSILAPNNSQRSIENSQGFIDKYRLFKTHIFSETGTAWKNLSTRLVCLGTQTSVDKLHWLVELVNQWTGPVSISVFTPDIELAIARGYINFIRKCFPSVRERVSFHMTAPVDKPGVDTKLEMKIEETLEQISCAEHKKALTFLLKSRSATMMFWRESLPYPQNLLRNIAKAGCQTNYTFIPDIDMLPVPGMNTDLEIFLKDQEEAGNCSKCAYVIPTYEISNDAKNLPPNKTELLMFVRKKLARQFHKVLFAKNQKSSNLNRWEKIPQDGPLGVAYKVDKYIFEYEPLYVARADSPSFDERFIGFGMTRSTQVYEMFMAGYTFNILNNAFTSHWGFQSLSAQPRWRRKQTSRNRAKFPAFAKEVSARYG